MTNPTWLPRKVSAARAARFTKWAAAGLFICALAAVGAPAAPAQSFDIVAEVVSRYPDEADMSASGWLLGDELLRNQANVISFDVEQGTVVTMGTQVDFRTQSRATFKLLFNAIFQGPATPVDAKSLAALQ